MEYVRDFMVVSVLEGLMSTCLLDTAATGLWSALPALSGGRLLYEARHAAKSHSFIITIKIAILSLRHETHKIILSKIGTKINFLVWGKSCIG